MNKFAEDAIRAFGMSGYQVSDDLRRIEEDKKVSLGHLGNSSTDGPYEPAQYFEIAVRTEAQEMAKYYVLFYCLEKSIRQLISNILTDVSGSNWWDSGCVPQQVADEVKRRRKEETDSGVTSRSDNPIDFTTFGELEVIITSNWKKFEVVFDSQRAVQGIIKRLNVLRGPIAHCCSYTDDEKKRLELTVKDWIRLL